MDTDFSESQEGTKLTEGDQLQITQMGTDDWGAHSVPACIRGWRIMGRLGERKPSFAPNQELRGHDPFIKTPH
ncbi:hypothetical protein QQ054_11190 [Oscillatoria amoena NRMC-F 0135]|nr:hypothetical protein [Oscillatoria amoena NRMC-F 0135]